MSHQGDRLREGKMEKLSGKENQVQARKYGSRVPTNRSYLRAPPQIFDGEEFSKMLRLWTNGYDVYTPSRSYIGHDYGHTDPKVNLANNEKICKGKLLFFSECHRHVCVVCGVCSSMRFSVLHWRPKSRHHQSFGDLERRFVPKISRLSHHVFDGFNVKIPGSQAASLPCPPPLPPLRLRNVFMGHASSRTPFFFCQMFSVVLSSFLHAFEKLIHANIDLFTDCRVLWLLV